MVIDHNGNKFETQREMCAFYKIKETTYINRIRNGWTVKRALTEKSKKVNRGISLRQFCIENNLEVIIEQFDSEKNYPETVDTVSAKSDKKYYFTYDCPKHHTKAQRVADKTSKKSIRCPICQNRGAIGKSIADEYPNTYAIMFNEEKNGIKATEVPVRSGDIYWWTCITCGNEFKGKPAYVTSGKKVCQECNNKRQSDAEKILSYYLRKLDEKRVINYKIEGWKYDFYLPKYKLLIEYDGYPWHNEKRAQNNDVLKDEIAIRNGFRICRLRDKRLTPNKDIKALMWEFTYDYAYRYFEGFPEFLCRIIGNDALKLDFDVARDCKEIHIHYIEERKKDSLLSIMPEIVEFLDMDDNRNGNPEFVYTQSHKLRFYFRHPLYIGLKWNDSAHTLFSRKGGLMPQAIKMCVKIIEMYPELEDEVSEIGMGMREQTIIKKRCDECGEEILLKYTQLYYSKGKKKLCSECLKKYRLSNILR